MEAIKQNGLRFFLSVAITILLLALFCTPLFINTVWAGGFIALEEAKALAKGNDDAYRELKETYTLKKQAFLDTWDVKKHEIEPLPDRTTLLSEAVEGEMELPYAAWEYLSAEVRFLAEKRRIAYEIERVYLTSMLAQQHLAIAETQLKQRETQLVNIKLEQSYGIAGINEANEVEEAWQTAKDEVIEAEEVFNSAMEDLGKRIGLPLDSKWFVQRELLYKYVNGGLLDNLLPQAFEADRDIKLVSLDTKLAYVKKGITNKFFRHKLKSYETSILEAASFQGNDEAEVATQWKSWLWLKEREGENTAIFDDFQFSLSHVCYQARQTEHNEIEEKMVAILSMQDVFTEALAVPDRILPEEESLARSRDSYKFALVKYNFGIAGYEELIKWEDELVEAKNSYYDAVFAGQEILSNFNYKTNGALTNDFGGNNEDESVREHALSVITASSESPLWEEKLNTAIAVFQQISERIETGYAAALEEEEMEISAGLEQLQAAIKEKLRRLSIETLLKKHTPPEAMETAERIRLLEKENYSQDELSALYDTGKELTTGLSSIQALPVESVLAPTHTIKLKVPPVLHRGRIYVSPDFFAGLMGGEYSVERAVTGEEINDFLVMVSANNLITWNMGGTTLYLNGRAVDFELLPLKIGEHLLLPLRPLGERMGLQVHWHGELGITHVADSDIEHSLIY